MAIVQIDDVAVAKPPLDHLHGSYLDGPAPGDTSEIFSFEVTGWALGMSSPVAQFEVWQEERLLAELPPSVPRPDIASAFPGVPRAEKSGFRASIGAFDLRSRFEVMLHVRLESGLRLPLARITGKRQPLQVGTELRISPLAINTIGRSGSTWLVHLLNSHPQIVAYNPFAKDVRVATYWMAVLQTLCQPTSYRSAFDPVNLEDRLWWLRQGGAPLEDSRVESWFGRERIEGLVGMCAAQIERFYESLAGAEEGTRYFVEKFQPYQVIPDLLAELYPKAGEVILVRDFRDTLCSILAFNAKRGYQAFGRARSATDADYVIQTLGPSADTLLRRWRQRGSAVHVLRYEDLVLEPAATLTVLMRFLDLDAGSNTVQATIERASRSSEATQGHRTSADPSASIGRWGQDLPGELIDLCNDVLGPALSEFGYPVQERPIAGSEG